MGPEGAFRIKDFVVSMKKSLLQSILGEVHCRVSMEILLSVGNVL